MIAGIVDDKIQSGMRVTAGNESGMEREMVGGTPTEHLTMRFGNTSNRESEHAVGIMTRDHDREEEIRGTVMATVIAIGREVGGTERGEIEAGIDRGREGERMNGAGAEAEMAVDTMIRRSITDFPGKKIRSISI